jgi:hypothetical protein
MEPKDLFENASEKPKESPLKSLETDLILYSETLKEIALEILEEKLSEFPIFIAHQHQVSLGEQVVDKEELSTEWNINVSFLEDFIRHGAILEEKVEFFKKSYKDPKNYVCLFLVVPEGANFVFFPYK